MVRESAASDAAMAADYSRAQKKKARRNPQNQHDLFLTGVDTPNYSQDVRKPCQQRVVQWIPIRARSVSTLITSCWVVWGLLLAAHYFLHTTANSVGRSPIPVLQLLDLRSPHSIANWMTCQLWLLTAFASWMVYNIRQHRLDDFSATYRVWFVMIGLSLFSCFDTSTSATYLVGQSIDPWTRREIGYGGWPLILAAYASVVALVGIKLSSEMRQSQASLWLWLGGLLAWGCAALLGTGLLKIQWSPGVIDLIVGGCWLGGVLAVFQAVGLILRLCYMQAQRRFLERTVLSKPKLDWADTDSDSVSSEDAQDDSDQSRSTSDEKKKSQDEKKSWLPWRRNREQEDSDDQAGLADKPNGKKELKEPKEPKKPMRLFGLFPHRVERNEQLNGIEPVRVDDQVVVDQGLTKKPGWFTRRSSQTPQETQAQSSAPASRTSASGAATPQAAATQAVAKQAPFPSTTPKQTAESKSTELKANDQQPSEQSKRSWFGSVMRKKTSAVDESKTDSPKLVSKETKTKDPETQEPAVKKSWFAIGKEKSDVKSASTTPIESTKAKAIERVEAFEILDEPPPKSGKLAKRLFGWLDGLRFKPPKDAGDSTKSKSASSASANPTSSNPSSSKPTSSSNASGNSTKGQQVQGDQDEEESDEDYSDYRNLSKAERKRLRRQQNDRGAA